MNTDLLKDEKNELESEILKPEVLIPCIDTAKSSFVYYSNGFVKVTMDGYEFFQYSSNQDYIPKEIINRNFNKDSETGDFSKFCFNVSGKKESKFLFLKTIIGYLLHDYKEDITKLIVFTNQDPNANSRTGKSLMGKAIGRMTNVSEILGTDFHLRNEFKYTSVGSRTKVIFLDDVLKKLHLGNLIDDINNGIVKEEKGKNCLIYPKMLITCDKIDTINGSGLSYGEKIIEFNFSDYYNSSCGPENESGKWFFWEWLPDEWQRFDNFMMECLSLYLDKGIIYPPQ